MSGLNDHVYTQRKRYCDAWNETMIEIWKDRIALLGVYDSGALMSSIMSMKYVSADDYTEVQMQFGFLQYGVWQDLGTGREVARGNPGDIGRAKVRERRQWFSKAFYSSVLNIRNFMADNIGREFAGIVSNGLTTDRLRNSNS